VTDRLRDEAVVEVLQEVARAAQVGLERPDVILVERLMKRQRTVRSSLDHASGYQPKSPVNGVADVIALQELRPIRGPKLFPKIRSK